MSASRLNSASALSSRRNSPASCDAWMQAMIGSASTRSQVANRWRSSSEKMASDVRNAMNRTESGSTQKKKKRRAEFFNRSSGLAPLLPSTMVWFKRSRSRVTTASSNAILPA